MSSARCPPPQFSVVIVGAGPAGLTLALLLARSGVPPQSLCIIDKRSLRTQTGHASGLQPRTLELLHTLGLYHALAAGSGAVVETAFWGESAMDDIDKGKGEKGGIVRSSVAPEVVSATSKDRLIVRDQGRTEEVFNRELEALGVKVKRPFEFVDYEYDEDCDIEFPIVAYVRDVNRGVVEKWKTKYLIAADGARSLVRDISGVESTVLESEDQWLVTDARVKTTFPDWRRRSAVQSGHGNAMLIPNPGDGLRIYMLLRKEEVEELDQSRLEGRRKMGNGEGNRITLRGVLDRRLPKIMAPYTIEIEGVEWISRYPIAQRVISTFMDNKGHVLFIGDSAHSHSPKAAQGMNTGIQDAWNVAWKLSLIIRKKGKDDALLRSFNEERRLIAKQLIEFDRNFAKMFAAKGAKNAPEFMELWRKSSGFTSGCGHQYESSDLVVGQAIEIENPLAVEPLTPGRRFLPMNLVRCIDGWTINSLDVTPARGQFCEIVFAGDIATEPRRTKFRELYDFLVSKKSALSKYNVLNEGMNAWAYEDIYTPDAKNQGMVIDLFIVHTNDHLKLNLRPDFETWKYNFLEDKGAEEHKRHGIDAAGEMVVTVVRPDGIVGMVCDVNNVAEVGRYFDKFMF
ncbi:MAG: hypothetical protein Q9227_006216 [Pyrenula ochraceoflavens]